MKTRFKIGLVFWTIFLLISLCALCVHAQNPKTDKIYKADNTTIDCKIMEVGPDEIKYKKASYLDGPTYTIHKSEVVTIQYANGESEVITANKPVAKVQPLQAEASEQTSQPEPKGSSQKFNESVVGVYFRGEGIYLGADYDIFWRLDDDSKNSNLYLGFGIQGYYGFGTTGTYGNIGEDHLGRPINISAGTLSSSVLYIPAQFRIFPSNSNFFIEAQAGPVFNFWKWSGNTSTSYESDSGTKITFAPGVNVGYVSRGGWGFTARWNAAMGFGVGVNISHLERRK